MKNTKKDPLQRAYEIRKIIDPIFPFDILVFNSQEIKKRLKMGDFFIEKIINQGKVLYEKRTEKDAREAIEIAESIGRLVKIKTGAWKK